MKEKVFTFSNIKNDIASGLVVFLVALPLCLAIAVASGASPFAGIIGGIVGGIIVGFLSNSQLSVTGPAAGLTAIVLAAITDLGAFDIFMLAVVLAGCIQVLLGFAKAGSLSNYFPTSVIEGMLTAIGIIIILKQIPHAFGFDKDPEGDFNFIEPTGNTELDTLIFSINNIHLGATLISITGLVILIVWDKIEFLKKIKLVPPALVTVIVGVLMNQAFVASGSSLAVLSGHLVKLPDISTISTSFSLPNFTQILNPKVWMVAVTIAIVASIETLLCIEATDKMDPLKRFTNTNTELKAQGIGNIISGLLGGLPITSVVVRSSANVNSGGRTKISTIVHGILLLLCVLSIPTILNMIPLATLAAILLMIGFKLAKPTLFIHMWKNGKKQFLPFIITVLGVVFIDLLKGVSIGLMVSIFLVLRENLKIAYSLDKINHNENDPYVLKLAQEVSFLNKAAIKRTLYSIPENNSIVIDASAAAYIDFDVIQLIKEFNNIASKEKNINVELVGFKEEYKMLH
ncbi:MAG: SulP family inorganic anion transporter [Bacteroidota bacterium]